MVANKKDLIEEYYDKEKVTIDEGITFANEINAIFKTVSAKTGEGIDDLFQTIGKNFLNQNIGNIGVKELRKKLKKYLDF